MFDLEKAYDTTWEYGIMRDLHDLNLRGRLSIFIENFLTERKFQVNINNSLSEIVDQEEDGVDKSLFVDDCQIFYSAFRVSPIECKFQHSLDKPLKWCMENWFDYFN